MEFRLMFLTLKLIAITAVKGTSNRSYEHLVRQALLTDYDKSVLPKLGGGHVRIQFGLKINKLIKVDNKEQLLKIDTWVIMKWNNTFLQWDKAKYGGTDVVQFSPSEIWFPDIQLYNNADLETPRAGGVDKFLSDVQVQNNGRCVWSGPATFTVNCEMKLSTYPFDKQSCEMRFGSYSYAKNKIQIYVFKTKKSKGDKYVQSGDWDLSKVEVKTGDTDHGDCCPYQFSEISYTVYMARRFQYHMFYLVGPCAMLSALSLISFLIPTESGERIGFVTTLLLGMMVFLLIIPESLPESSKSIPILGVLMMVTMILIALILVVTILILKCFHSKRKPPQFLRKKFARTKSHRQMSHSKGSGSESLGIDNINLRAVSPGNDSRPPSVEAFRKQKEMDNEATWQAFARLCDKIMFVVFLVFTIAMYATTMSIRD